MLFWLFRILVLIFLFPQFALAFPEIKVRTEESIWIAELINQGSDGWPVVVSRKIFPSKAQAQAQAQIFKNRLLPSDKKYIELKLANAKLWETKESWSVEWEKRYSHWIESEVDAEFFVRYNIATDCADVAYSLRWIFSRIHGLPAAAHLGGGKILMTNEMVRPEWQNLPSAAEWYKDRRFLAALNYLLTLTYTHTLWADSFPVALNREALLSGSYNLELHNNSGHTQVIHWLGGEAIPFLTLNSTVPRKVRTLMDQTLFANFPKDNETALLRFRWPIKTSSGMFLKKSSEMPGYSLEQFSFKSKKPFTFALYEKLGFTADSDALLNFLYKDLFDLFYARTQIVEEGFNKCQQINCNPGTTGWEDWGTFSRDSRIKGKIATLTSVDFSWSQSKNSNLKKEIIKLEGLSWDLKAMIWNWKNSIFSSDPRESIASRWGAGKETWLLSQKNFFGGTIFSRYEHLEKSRVLCQKQDCSFGSKEWSQKSSNAFDVQLAKRIRYISQGASFLPQQVLDLFSQDINEVVIKIQDFNVTLKHVFDNHLKMNSSPLASLKDQWSMEEDFSLIKLKLSTAKPYFDQWLWDEPTSRLYERTSQNEFDLGGDVLVVFKNAPLAIVQDAAKAELVELTTGRKVVLPFQLTKSKVHYLSGSDRLIIRSEQYGTQIWGLNKQELGLNLLQTLPGTEWLLLADDFLEKDGQLFDILYLKYYIDRITWNQYFVLNNQYVGYIDNLNQHFLLNRINGLKEILNVENGYSISYFDEALKYYITNDYQRSQIYVLDSQRTAISQLKIDGLCSPSDGDYIICYARNLVQIYKYHNGDILSVMSDNGLLAITDDYYINKLSENRIQVINRKDKNKIMLEAGSLISIEGESYLAKVSGEESWHIINIFNNKEALFTNIFIANGDIHIRNVNDDTVFFTYSDSLEGAAILWNRNKSKAVKSH